MYISIMSQCPPPCNSSIDACCLATLGKLDQIIVNTNSIEINTDDLETLIGISNTSLASIDLKLTSPITVTAVNLDIRDLVFATDKVDVSGSTVNIGSIAQLPPALIGGRLDTNIGSWLGSTAPTVGQKIMADSIPVVISSDQSAIPVSGTVTALQGTSPWVISGTIAVTNSDDHNYGIVGVNTLRTASQIGNATGAADFNAGTTTAQVLRVVLPTDQTVIPVQGQKTNNNAAPGATNVGVLPALATAAVQTWTEGNQVLISTDLSGYIRIIAKSDIGKNQTNFFMAIQIITTPTDALLSLTGYKLGAAVGATTTPAVVTTGKTYRIDSITMSYTTIVTTPGSVRFTLRANTGGVVAITSPAVCNWEVGEPTGIAPVAGKKNTINLSFANGIEFAAGTGIGISQVGLNTVGVAAFAGYGQITINGFEY